MNLLLPGNNIGLQKQFALGSAGSSLAHSKLTTENRLCSHDPQALLDAEVKTNTDFIPHVRLVGPSLGRFILTSH